MHITWQHIREMAAILEAEVAGHSVDADHAKRVAMALAEQCPAVANTMQRIARRMEMQGEQA
ncbi:MAG: hypothetical protein HY985_05640 [Magnetospirillum sp.]|nr:hypothetical protein [Magnetospirillum sp.]